MPILVDRGPCGPTSSLYVHVPYCRDRCTYCAFPTVADRPDEHRPLIRAVLGELGRAPPTGRIETIYLGGGTPGLLAPDDLRTLLDGLRDQIAISSDSEITLELNPANVSPQALQAWGELGVTRLSLGIQTFDDNALRSFGRHHDSSQGQRALEWLASRWTHTWSADLLVGWQAQSPAGLAGDVDELLRFAPPHVSIYGLTIEPGTPLARVVYKDLKPHSNRHLAPSLDDIWSSRLAARGYERYEVSNFARPGHRSRHNQVYWRNESYRGLGPGAASSEHPHRWTNLASPGVYIDAIARGRSLRAHCERLAPIDRLLECLAVGLRTLDGLCIPDLDRRFSPAWRALFAAPARSLLDQGLIALAGTSLQIPAGQLLKADRILAELASSFGQHGQRAERLPG